MKLSNTMFCIGMVLALATVACAIAPANWVTKVSETRYTTGAANGSASDVTEGGNITILNINVGNRTSTDRWAGYLGNITNNAGGRLVLANSAATIFYQWSLNISNGGEVCAGEGTTYTWTSLSAATNAEIDTAWGFGVVSDNATRTFNDAAVAVNIASTTITPAYSADTGIQGAGTFFTTAVKDGTAAESDFLFCTNLNISATANGYDGSSVDYELIVPTTSGAATETYYFYAEIN